MAEQGQDQATEVKQEQETVKEPVQAEELEEHIVDGEVLKLSKAERAQAIAIAVRAIKAEQGRKTAPAPVKEPEVTLTREQKLEKELAEIRGEVRDFKNTSENTSIIAGVENLVRSNTNIPTELKEMLTENILAKIALAKASGAKVTPQQIAQAVVEQAEKNTTKFKAVVDAEQKLKDAEKTRLGTPSGRTVGQEPPAQHTRKSFRDGSLVKATTEFYKQRLAAASE